MTKTDWFNDWKCEKDEKGWYGYENSLGNFTQDRADVACEVAKKMNIDIHQQTPKLTLSPGYRELIFTGASHTDLTDFWSAVDAECDVRGIQYKNF